MPSMPKVRASSGTIGTTRWPSSLSRISAVSMRTNACVVEISRPSAVGSSTALNADSSGTSQLLVGVAPALRQVAAERRRRSCRYCISGESSAGRKNGSSSSLSSGIGMLKRSRNSRIASTSSFFSWWVGFFASPTLAHAVALDGLGEDHRRLAVVLDRRGEGRVDLVRIVAAAVQAPDVLVGHARDHLEQLRILAEEVLAHEGAVVGLVVLVLAVDGLLHHALQDAVLVAREQRVPVRAPDQLDHVPAGAAEVALELLDDLAVAAHRTVEALQVAVDDEDQVVELLARRQADRAERLGLVHLAVAAEHPDLAVAGVGDAARVQVLQEARLVDRHDRAQAHRHGRELPEVRHQLRMRIRRQALAVDFAAEVRQLLLGQPPFEVGARVETRATSGPGSRPGRRRGPRAARARSGSCRRRSACHRREAGDVAAEITAVGRVRGWRAPPSPSRSSGT